MTFRKVASINDLWEGEKLALLVEHQHLLLFKLDGMITAYEDRCAHQGVPLNQGKLEGKLLTCASHHWQYDATTGKGINPKSAQLKRFPVKIENEDILLDLDFNE